MTDDPSLLRGENTILVCRSTEIVDSLNRSTTFTLPILTISFRKPSNLLKLQITRDI